jgi:hypothetical protein
LLLPGGFNFYAAGNGNINGALNPFLMYKKIFAFLFFPLLLDSLQYNSLPICSILCYRLPPFAGIFFFISYLSCPGLVRVLFGSCSENALGGPGIY